MTGRHIGGRRVMRVHILRGASGLVQHQRFAVRYKYFVSKLLDYVLQRPYVSIQHLQSARILLDEVHLPRLQLHTLGQETPSFLQGIKLLLADAQDLPLQTLVVVSADTQLLLLETQSVVGAIKLAPQEIQTFLEYFVAPVPHEPVKRFVRSMSTRKDDKRCSTY